MSRRFHALWAIAVLTVTLSSIVFVADVQGNISSIFSPLGIDAAATSRAPVKLPSGEEVAANFFDAAAKSLGINNELALYGTVGAIAAIIVVLVLSSAAFNSKSRAEARLEILIQEKEKAENLARLKSEFLNQVSHELRTPLAVIIGYIECMTDGLYGQIETKHQEILQVVAKQSAHLKNMIDQILIYSRLEAGKQPVRIEELQLTKIINEMKDTFEFLCRQKGLDLRWDLPRDVVTVHSDAMRVKEVISNLLQNAVKYTDHGSITLRLEKVPMKSSFAIEVADTGMGISEQHLTSIFEPFMQAHKTSTTNSRGGIGLGLSIVKKHIEQIRGVITVESELGKGSTFRIVLPSNYDDQPSEKNWLGKLFRFPQFSVGAKQPNAKPDLTAASRKTVDTRHAMG
jgi:signal transduction histidine kinase